MEISESTLSPLFSTLWQSYQQSEQKSGRIERFYTIAGYTVCLRFAGSALLPRVTRALAHLATAATPNPDLTLCLADSASSGIPAPTPPSPPGIYRLAEGRLYFCHYGQELWQEAFAPSLRLGILVIGSADHYPAYAEAAPLRNMLLWWLAHQGLYGLHSAAIGAHGGAALIVGNGGAGKSTTAVACLQAGLAYLGDDFCILDFDPLPRIHSLYSSGKLCADSRRWLTPCTATASRLDEDGKMVYQWHPHFQAQLPSTLPIRAILLPMVNGAGHTTVHPATPSEAFTALSTATLRATTWPTPLAQGLLAAIKRLVQQAPSYHLALGTETAQIPATVLHVLQEHSKG